MRVHQIEAAWKLLGELEREQANRAAIIEGPITIEVRAGAHIYWNVEHNTAEYKEVSAILLRDVNQNITKLETSLRELGVDLTELKAVA